jgi:hypothetical protein
LCSGSGCIDLSPYGLPRAAIGFEMDRRAIGMMNVHSAVGMADREPTLFGESRDVVMQRWRVDGSAKCVVLPSPAARLGGADPVA